MSSMIAYGEFDAVLASWILGVGALKEGHAHLQVHRELMLAQIIWFGYQIGELSYPTKYFEDASSINFHRSVVYGLGVLNRKESISSGAAMHLHI